MCMVKKQNQKKLQDQFTWKIMKDNSYLKKEGTVPF